MSLLLEPSGVTWKAICLPSGDQSGASSLLSGISPVRSLALPPSNGITYRSVLPWPFSEVSAANTTSLPSGEGAGQVLIPLSLAVTRLTLTKGDVVAGGVPTVAGGVLPLGSVGGRPSVAVGPRVGSPPGKNFTGT